MEKQMLRCDICGGELEMQGGNKAVCTSCGMKYSTESLREKFNGLKVSITGSRGDVEQWKTLVKTYLNQHDFIAAEGTVKKILEAAPSDEFANNMYSLLQEWKYLEIVNGTLIKYNGRAHDIILPEGIQTIGESAFKDSKIRSITLPASTQTIENDAFNGCRSIESIDLSNIKSMGWRCFYGCTSLSHVTLSQDLMTIPRESFRQTALAEIIIPKSVKDIEYGAFANCEALKCVSVPENVKSIGNDAFGGCSSLSDVKISKESLNDLFQRYSIKPDYEYRSFEPFAGCPWWEAYKERRIARNRRDNNVCEYCGGMFRGLFTKVCTKCGKEKSY